MTPYIDFLQEDLFWIWFFRHSNFTFIAATIELVNLPFYWSSFSLSFYLFQHFTLLLRATVVLCIMWWFQSSHLYLWENLCWLILRFISLFFFLTICGLFQDSSLTSMFKSVNLLFLPLQSPTFAPIEHQRKNYCMYSSDLCGCRHIIVSEQHF